MSESYEIVYVDEAVADIRALRAFDQRKVLEGIELHVTHQPKFVSRSRIKLMQQPFWSQYRLCPGVKSVNSPQTAYPRPRKNATAGVPAVSR